MDKEQRRNIPKTVPRPPEKVGLVPLPVKPWSGLFVCGVKANGTTTGFHDSRYVISAGFKKLNY